MSSYSQYTDEELACMLAADDSIAFTEIYDRYAGVLYLHVHRKVGDREIAKDLIHDIFESLWDSRIDLNIRGRLSHYLYTAARYKVINSIRREKRFVDIPLECESELLVSQQPQADVLLINNELQQLIEAEANLLPTRMREIFMMSRAQQLSHQEIAEQLNLSPATVKKQVNNALKVLRIKFHHLLSLTFLLHL